MEKEEEELVDEEVVKGAETAEAETVAVAKVQEVEGWVAAAARVRARVGEGAKAEFTWLKEALGLTEGNLSSHLQKLEEAGYVRVEKGFRGKRPKTWVALTPEGRAAYEAYRKALLDLLQGR